jgi:hypothetical protein
MMVMAFQSSPILNLPRASLGFSFGLLRGTSVNTRGVPSTQVAESEIPDREPYRAGEGK